MRPPSYMRSIVDRNVVMRRMTVYYSCLCKPWRHVEGGIAPPFLNLGTRWNWRNWTHIFLYDYGRNGQIHASASVPLFSPPPQKRLPSDEWEDVWAGGCGEENKINYKFKDLSLVADGVRLLDWRLWWIPLNPDRISKLISSSSLWSPFAGTAHCVSFKVRYLLLQSGLIFPWHWTHCNW